MTVTDEPATTSDESSIVPELLVDQLDALKVLRATSDEEKADLAMGRCALYQLYERQAELCRQAGDDRAASESYASASEAALEAGKTKIAMTLQAKSEECAPQDEDCV